MPNYICKLLGIAPSWQFSQNFTAIAIYADGATPNILPKQHPEKNSFAASTVVLVKKLWRTVTCLGAIFLEIWDRFIVSRFITWLICPRILFCRLMLAECGSVRWRRARTWFLLKTGEREHFLRNIFIFFYSPLSNGFQSVIIYLTS